MDALRREQGTSFRVLQIQSHPTDKDAMNQLPDILRNSAQRFIAEIIELELDHFLKQFTQQQNVDGHQKVVRNGHHPERRVLTGIGPVPVSLPKIRSRSEKSAKFRSALVPAYMRQAYQRHSISHPPRLYLSAVARRDYECALTALFGSGTCHIPQAIGTRIEEAWRIQWENWFKRSLDGSTWSELWIDKVQGLIHNGNAHACMLVATGVDNACNSQLLSVRECSGNIDFDLRELLLDLKTREFTAPKNLVLGKKLARFAQSLEPLPLPSDLQLRLESIMDYSDADAAVDAAFASFLDTVTGTGRCSQNCSAGNACQPNKIVFQE